MYEVSWSRQIGLLFGHTLYAAAVVLASYFAGMSLGYLLGARWSTRVSPMAGYAGAEWLIGAWGCCIPLMLSWSSSPDVLAWLSSSSFVWQTSVRSAFCFLLLLPATTAMGVTLPMMADFVSGQRTHDVSMAYACNTFGAMVGVLFATFFSLVVVGVRNTNYVAAGISALCGLAACLLMKVQPLSVGDEANRHEPSSLRPWGVLAALSGFGTLALEVLYTRMFSLVFHNSTYTFGSVVVVFLAALSLGAALASRLQRKYPTNALLGWATGLGGLAVLLSVVVFVELTGLEYYTFGESFLQYTSGTLLLVFLVVAPPITLLGMVLPLAWNAVQQHDDAGRVVGRLTAINTIASAAGALCASILFLPWLGLWPTFTLLGLAVSLVPLALLVRTGQIGSACAGALLVAVLAVLTLRSPTDVYHTHSKRGETLVRRWRSPYGWIDVVKVNETGSFRVRQNLHYRFGETKDNAREYRQAHLPLLLHSRPRDVLFLGLGTGLTAGGAVPHREVERITVVELIPEVVEAARFLADYNNGVVDRPNVEIHVDDARHYLLATDRRFEVIVSDLFVPWESEAGYLYTVEHYRVARARLKPGGIVCQWIPLYQLGSREFELIADSFASVFPATTIWWGEVDPNMPIIALVGSEGPINIDADRLANRLAELQQTAQTTDADLRSPESLYGTYQGDWAVRRPNRLNTDEHPRVEFLTPISNRNRRLLHGKTLERFYDDVFTKLPARLARLRSSGQVAPAEVLKRSRAWRRFILFGE